MPLALHADHFHGTDREKGVKDGGAQQVEPRLQVVDELVQSAGDDLLGPRVGQFRAELAQELFRPVAEAAHVRAGDRVQRLVRLGQAVQNGAGELAVEDEELDDAGRRDSAVSLPVHLERAGRAQQGRPLNVVVGSADVVRVRAAG